ncbi:hypothetical protein [Marinilabilia salmonicolor]|uniref:hypothetical protein n=1 Tax=Marinilabilia salmonicolor TaxID=989 RepID=UPI001F1B5E27|nr:hypothetical protein [Marinilabilia salmonicolor]
MKKILSIILLTLIPVLSWAQNPEVTSPNSKIRIVPDSRDDKNFDEWHLKVYYTINNTPTLIIPKIKLGITRNDQTFDKNLKLLKFSKPNRISEEYTACTGNDLFGKIQPMK